LPSADPAALYTSPEANPLAIPLRENNPPISLKKENREQMLSSTTLRPRVPAAASPSPAHLTACSSPALGRRAPAAAVAVRAARNYDSIPKREPFSSSRSILDEFLRLDKPLVQCTKDQITGTPPLGSRTALASSLHDLFS
jgi:hypothetical protein